MRNASLQRLLRWTTAAVHLAICGALVAMIVPSFGNIARQLHSGYVPPFYWLYLVVIAVTLALAGAVGVALVKWLQGSRRTLVAVDISVLIASWSFLSIFVFSNDAPIATWILSPIAVVLAWRGPMRRAPAVTG